MTLTYIRIVFQSICLLVALYQSNSQAADTNLVDDAYTQELARMDMIAGSCTNLVAAADWSKLVYDSRGNGLRGRLLVYDGAHFTNMFGIPCWFAAPVYLDIQDEAGVSNPPTQVYFDWEKGIHFELHDAKGQPADYLKPHGGGSYVDRRPYWARVPADGLLRLRADLGSHSTLVGTERYNLGGLNLFLSPHEWWIIPADDTNTYFLSATISLTLANSSPDNHDVWQSALEFPAVKLSAVKH